jgi:hypothetical protein
MARVFGWTPVRITEEVEGCKPERKWFIYFPLTPGFDDFEFFRTLDEAKAWCRAQGLAYIVEPLILDFLDLEEAMEQFPDLFK